MAGKETPVMQQHAAAKRSHPDCIVFFRLGDFYEMFGDDAVVASAALELTLTSRNKGKPDEVPMAGVPHHAAQGYIARLLEKGHKVAICEQMADPSTVKGIVPREVVRVITQGTWTESEQLEQSENNWLCTVELDGTGVGVALLDLSTAELLAARIPDLSSALSELSRMRPREVLVFSDGEMDSVLTSLREVNFGSAVRGARAIEPSELKRVLSGIDVRGAEPVVERAVARAVSYAEECFRGKAPPIWRVGLWNPSGVLGLDRAAQRHLELVESSVGDKRATLLAILDRTQTSGGARLLRRRLLAPLTEIAEIQRRLDQVEVFVRHGIVRAELREALADVTDLERLSVRATLGEASPRDLGAIRRGLSAAQLAIAALSNLPDEKTQQSVGFHAQVDLVEELRERLSAALVERPPVQAKEGAIFVEGFDSELDRLAQLRLRGAEEMTLFETQLREKTGVSQLRVRHTRVFGWYVEVSRTHSAKVPSSWRRKQTVATGERFTLPELDELADQISSAEERFRQRELELLRELQDEVVAAAARVHLLSSSLSVVDVASALAELAVDFDYQRPQVDESAHLEIVDGRHPVVERLAASGGFVPNDVELEAQKSHLWLISGPNMAGKSTFLRQVALIVVMAQMGSFVPARRARIGVVDRVLSRVGASDNLAGGESTFMVEMRETASILRTATSRSLVILDEVGRGTSTFDGLAIAWAVVEHLDQTIGCRSLFATHYHELTELGESGAGTKNYSVSAREHEGDVVFLHRVVPGAASRSYGVAVARLAGLPEPVLARARSLLVGFEGQLGPSTPQEKTPADRQLELFPAPKEDPVAHSMLSTLRELELDRLSGLEALNLLAQWKKQLRS